jgi:hypothetical protein
MARYVTTGERQSVEGRVVGIDCDIAGTPPVWNVSVSSMDAPRSVEGQQMFVAMPLGRLNVLKSHMWQSRNSEVEV